MWCTCGALVIHKACTNFDINVFMLYKDGNAWSSYKRWLRSLTIDKDFLVWNLVFWGIKSISHKTVIFVL